MPLERTVEGVARVNHGLPDATHASPKVKSRVWLVGCVRGSARGYRRGTVSMRRVNAHVAIALAHGVSLAELMPLLAPQGLRWDFHRGAVVDTGFVSVGF